MKSLYLISTVIIATVVVFAYLYFFPPAGFAPQTAQQPAPTSTTTLANPASENCLKLGGQLFTDKRGDGGEYTLCQFEDNRACEEWALFRNECPYGGRKTTGFDSIDQKYCAWVGGDTYAVPNSVCTFPNKSTCPTIELYNGLCSSH